MTRLEPHQLKELAISCLEGDAEAKTTFQHLFGESIYNYPVKAFHLPKDKAADFYIYVFDKDRVFRRLGTFQGRNGAQFETYLCYYVLRDLFLEWRRSEKEPETVSLETIGPGSDSGSSEGPTFTEEIFDQSSSNKSIAGSDENTPLLKAAISNIDVEKRVIIKLLCLAEFDLNADEIRFVCQKSGRSYRETVTLIEEIRYRLTKKDEQSAALQDQLDSIFGWTLLYQRDLAKITENLMSVSLGTSEHGRLCRQKEELERKLEWRYRQQRQVKEKARQFRTNTPYKDIARLLNVPIGTVCSLVARTRSEIAGTLGYPTGLEQAAV